MGERDPASILTDSQRKYLRGESEPAYPDKYDERIRTRIEWGMADMATLFKHLGDDERRKVFGPHYAGSKSLGQESAGETPGETSMAPPFMPRVFAFLALALNVDEAPPLPPIQERAFKNLVSDLESGIGIYLLEKFDIEAKVTVSIELDELTEAED